MRSGFRPAAGYVPLRRIGDVGGKAYIAIFPSISRQVVDESFDSGVLSVTFGNSSDKLVQGDYTGDGKSDDALFRPSTGEWSNALLNPRPQSDIRNDRAVRRNLGKIQIGWFWKPLAGLFSTMGLER